MTTSKTEKSAAMDERTNQAFNLGFGTGLAAGVGALLVVLGILLDAGWIYAPMSRNCSQRARSISPIGNDVEAVKNLPGVPR